jgi:hypothetical protein
MHENHMHFTCAHYVKCILRVNYILIFENEKYSYTQFEK